MVSETVTPRRILLFIETGGPGGAERVVVELAHAYRALGHTVHVVTLRTGWLTQRLSSDGIPWEQIRSEQSLDLTLPLRIAAVIRRTKSDLLHSHLLDANFYGALAARLAGVSHIATEHGDVHHIVEKKLLRTKIALMRFLGTRLTAVSSFSAARLRELGYPNAIVIGNPVPRAAKKRSREAVRAELGADADTWLWLHVANFRPVKDQATLIRGFAASLTSAPGKQQLVLIGDGASRTELETLAAELRVPVTFLGFREDAGDYIAVADGFILSSLSEALPMSLLEAGEAGAVLISSDVGGVRDIIGEGCGFLFPAGKSDALGGRITQVLLNPGEARAAGTRAQVRIRSEFSACRVAEQYLALGAS